VREILFDRVRRDVLYAVTDRDEILRSRDGGVISPREARKASTSSGASTASTRTP
jgi:hypothetical protein